MRTARIVLTTAVFVLAATAAFGQANPCGGKATMAVNPCFAKAGTVFYVNDPAGRNFVTFKSTAPLEDIVGTTNQITGYLVFDPSKPKQGGKGELHVPVSGLNTGIPLRDEHLQGGVWLDAENHPHISLTITELKNVKEVKTSDDFQTYDVLLIGELSMKGQSRSVEIPGRVTYLKENDQTRQRMAGDLLAARAELEIALADFGVTGPEGAGLIGTKVGSRVTVEVSIMGTTNAPEMAANPCGGKSEKASNPCGK